MEFIYEKLKNQKDYNGSSGAEEINALYYIEVSEKEKKKLANEVVKNIIDMKTKENVEEYLKSVELPLLVCKDILMRRVNALVQEGIITEEQIKSLTRKFIFECKEKRLVQLGLLLGAKYLDANYILDVVKVFSKSGDYIFYLKELIYRLEGYNTFLLDLARKGTGSVKLFAIFNIEVFNSEIRNFILESNYKGEYEKDLLTDYIMTNVDIVSYIIEEEMTLGRINNLAYIVQNYISYNGLDNLDMKDKLIEKYIPVASEKGTNIYTLYSMYLIKKELIKYEEFNLGIGKYIHIIKGIINEEKWREVYIESLKDESLPIKLLIDLSIYYENNLYFDELEKFLRNDAEDISVYKYIVENGEVSDKQKLLDFFNSNFDLDELLKTPEDIKIEETNDNYIVDILLLFILRGCMLLDDIKEIVLKALKSRLNDTRLQASIILEKYHDFTDYERDLIEAAIIREPNEDIRYRLLGLNRKKVSKTTYIKVGNKKIIPYIDDIYLKTFKVNKVEGINKYYLQNAIEESDIYHVFLYKEDKLDIDDIKVVSLGGLIIGVISEEENDIFRNLIKGGKYLYCRLEEYDLSKNFIKLSLYLSVKDVIDYCEETLRLMSYPERKNNQ